jgi:hypothetical protein
VRENLVSGQLARQQLVEQEETLFSLYLIYRTDNPPREVSRWLMEQFPNRYWNWCSSNDPPACGVGSWSLARSEPQAMRLFR